MKSKILTLAAALTIALSARAAVLFPDGVVLSDSVNLSGLLASGWTLEFSQGFDTGPITQTMISQWQTDAGTGYVFVGGIDSKQNVLLGGTGLASQVLSQTTSTSTATLYSSSDLYWYNVVNPDGPGDSVGSIGFAQNSTILLNEADIYTDPDRSVDQYRLSWHTNFAGGGYRLGSDYSASGATKIVLIAPSSVPEGGSTLLLVGAVVAALGTWQRRRSA